LIGRNGDFVELGVLVVNYTKIVAGIGQVINGVIVIVSWERNN